MFDLYRKIKEVVGPEDLKKFYFLQVAVLFLAFFEMCSIGLIAPFLSMMMQPDIFETNTLLKTIKIFIGVADQKQFVFICGLFVFILYVLTNIYLVCVNWFVIRFSMTQGYEISSRLFSSYLSQNYLFFLKNNTAELSRVIFQDIARLTDCVITPFLMILSRGMSVIAILILLSFINLKITLISAIIFISCYGFIYFGIRKLLILIGERFTFYNNLRFRIVSEAFGGIKDCKIYGAEQFFSDAYRENSFHDSKNQTKRRVLLFIPKYFIESVAIGSLLIVSVVFYSKGYSSQLIATISVFAIAAYRLMPSLQQIYSDVSQIKSNLNSIDLILNHLKIGSSPNFELVDRGPETILSGDESIVVDGLSFSYPESDSVVLNDLKFAIKPRSIVGFAGKSGSGKSTMIDIVLGLLEYRHGHVFVNGQRLTSANARIWQRSLGYVPQSIHLIDGTLAENIAFGIEREAIDEEKVWRVLKSAQLNDFVKKELPNGLNSFVGEKGVRLSGGQRQRIGIARALYRDPEILVLDEATSALDGLTENAFIETVQSFSDKMTIIMVAHRLTSLRYCDVIYLLESGKIVDSGNYDYMCRNNQYFMTQMGNLN